MAKSEAAAAIYVAKEAFLLGGDQLVPAGATVAAGHPLLKKREHLFEPFKPMFDFDAEETTSSAGALAIRQALVAKAKSLGLSASGKSADLEAAVAAAEAEQAAAAEAAAKAAAEAPDAPPASGGDA